MKGRKPVPTQLKILAGNPGKRALPENEPEFDNEIPQLPDWLAGEALAAWHRLMPELHAVGIVAEAYRGPLVAYCEA